MSERIEKYLGALARRKPPLSLKQIEVLSSDFDVSQRDLERLVAQTRRYIGSKAILDAPVEDIYSELKNMVYSAYHDKDTLLLLLPDLGERYRKDKLKLVYDMLMLSIVQARGLGASPEELAQYAKFLGEREKRKWLRWVSISCLAFLLLLLLSYQAQRNWFNWAENFMAGWKGESSIHTYLGYEGHIEGEEPLGKSRNLELTVAVMGYNELPLKMGTSSVIVFPESYLYDLRAGITLSRPWEAYHYTLSVKDINEREIHSFSGEMKEPLTGAWEAGVTLPFEFQHFTIGRPKGTPFSLSLTLDEVKVASRSTEELPNTPLAIQNLSPHNLFLTGDLASLFWKENFGIWQGDFILELFHNFSGQVRSLTVNFLILDGGGNRITSFKKELLSKENSLPFSRGEKRRFVVSQDFIKMVVGDLPKKAKTYRMEVLAWQ